MAEAFAKRIGLKVSSAGTIPATHVNPLVIEAMKEVGLDVSQNVPKKLTEEMIDDADVVVLTDSSLERSMPRLLWKKMRKKVTRWNIPDPQGRTLDEIRLIRDEIRDEVRKSTEESPNSMR
jgi:protein-tyrosine-phosphatase